MQTAVLAATTALLGILGGCSFAPTYKTPSSAPPADAYAESGDWHKAEPQDDQSRGAWWEQFGDPQLDALEVKVDNANQSVQAAFARLQEARATTRVARADLFPTLDVGSSATRQRVSPNSPTYLPSHDPTYNNFDLQADFLVGQLGQKRKRSLSNTHDEPRGWMSRSDRRQQCPAR